VATDSQNAPFIAKQRRARRERPRRPREGALTLRVAGLLQAGDCASGGHERKSGAAGSECPCCAYARRWDRTGWRRGCSSSAAGVMLTGSVDCAFRVDGGLGVSGDSRRSAPSAPALQDRDGAHEPEGDHAEQARGADASVAPVDAVVGADRRGLRRFDGRDRLAQRLLMRRRALEARHDHTLSVGEYLWRAHVAAGEGAAARRGVACVRGTAGPAATGSPRPRRSSPARAARTRWWGSRCVGRWAWWPPGRWWGTARTLDLLGLRRRCLWSVGAVDGVVDRA
jgi:hypothetical protein